MIFSPEFKLLLLSCRLDDSGEEVVEASKIIGENHIQWNDLYARADFHGVKPQLSRLLEKITSPLISFWFPRKGEGSSTGQPGPSIALCC